MVTHYVENRMSTVHFICRAARTWNYQRPAGAAHDATIILTVRWAELSPSRRGGCAAASG